VAYSTKGHDFVLEERELETCIEMFINHSNYKEAKYRNR
jgi:hypothetical protein